MHRRRGCGGEVEAHLVDVAPEPAFAGFVGAHDRVGGRHEVAGGVAPRRAVAAADVTTGLADPQVHPVTAAGGEAFLAPPRRRCDGTDPVEVGAPHDTRSVLAMAIRVRTTRESMPSLRKMRRKWKSTVCRDRNMR